MATDEAMIKAKEQEDYKGEEYTAKEKKREPLRADCRLLDIAARAKTWLTPWQMKSDKTLQVRLPDYYKQQNTQHKVSAGTDNNVLATTTFTHASTPLPLASLTLRDPLLVLRDSPANDIKESA